MSKMGQAMDGVLAASNRRDVAGSGDYLAGDFTYENMTMPGRQGRDGFDAIHKTFFTAFPDIHYGLVNSLEAGNSLVTECVITGTHRGELLGIAATGKSITLPICFITEHDEQGRITSWKTYYDAATVLRQLGVIQ